MSQHETLTPTVDAILEQAQVFASAWSLVGGIFDKGGMLEEANQAKAELREMVSAALSATQPAQAAPSVESAIMKLISVCHRDGLERKDSATPESLAALDALRSAIKAQPAQSTPTPDDYKAYFERAAQGALSQQSERHLTVTTNPQGDAVLVSWQDDEHRILEVVWERKAQAAQGAGEVVAVACPYCGGSGESTIMSNGGPDAEELPCVCPHCEGHQTLEAAYRGVVKLLQAEHTKYIQLCGKLYFSTPTPAQPAPVVPEGWVLVPVEPTEEMLNAGDHNVNCNYHYGTPKSIARHAYGAMLTASPTPPAQAAADARDAERYRWLRNNGRAAGITVEQYTGSGISNVLAASAMDASIDAALANHQQRQDGGESV